MDNKDLRETQSIGIESCEITLKDGQKKHFDNRYLLFLLEGSTDVSKNDLEYSVISCQDVSDNELVNLISSLLEHLKNNKGYPKDMLAQLVFGNLE